MLKPSFGLVCVCWDSDVCDVHCGVFSYAGVGERGQAFNYWLKSCTLRKIIFFHISPWLHGGSPPIWISRASDCLVYFHRTNKYLSAGQLSCLALLPANRVVQLSYEVPTASSAETPSTAPLSTTRPVSTIRRARWKKNRLLIGFVVSTKTREKLGHLPWPWKLSPRISLFLEPSALCWRTWRTCNIVLHSNLVSIGTCLFNQSVSLCHRYFSSLTTFNHAIFS